MRTETKTIKIYEFNELNEKAKEKAREIIRGIEVDNFFEFCQEGMEQILEGNNLKDFNIEYSLSYCQGDGVCFYSNVESIVHYENLCDWNKEKEGLNPFEKYIIENMSEDKDLILRYFEVGNVVKIKKIDYHYSHSNTCVIENEWYGDFTDNEFCKIDLLLDKLRKPYQDLCKKLEDFGYSGYEVSDEDILDYLSYNDIEFLESGEIY